MHLSNDPMTRLPTGPTAKSSRTGTIQSNTSPTGGFSMRSFLFGSAALILAVALLGCARQPGTSATSPSHDDLTGVWIGPDKTLEPAAPMTPTGQAFFDAAKPLYGPRSVPVADSNDPVNTCDPQGFPRILFLRTPLSVMEFVQTPNRVFQFFQYQRVYREVWTDGRPLPA